MAEPGPLTTAEEAATPTPPPAAGRSKDEVALELMRFIAVTTGYGRSSQGTTGFSAKAATRTAEEQADALLELFARCRKVVNSEKE
jgi:hypothetical protein